MRRMIWCALVMFICTPWLAHAVPMTTFSVGHAAVTPGKTFGINVTVTNAVNLRDWRFYLFYNPTVLQANRVSEGPFLSSLGRTIFDPGIIDNKFGIISWVSASYRGDFPPLPSGSGVLANINFTAQSPGASSLIPHNVFLNFSNTGFAVTDGVVRVSPGAVPVPDTLGLALLGSVILWGGVRWRQRDGCAR